jgi:putative membrane protein
VKQTMPNSSNFSQPQRQSLIGVVVLFANTIQKTIRAFWPLVLIWMVRIESMNKLVLFGGTFVILVLLALFSYLQYHYFTFHIDEETEEFVIQKGVFNKTRITIQLHKIQQVNINQSLIQKLVNVHKLEIDTAGSDKKEASISAISHELALALKERLIALSKTSNETAVDEISEIEEKQTFIAIHLISLLKIGITSNYVRSFALILLFFSTILENIQKVVGDEVLDENQVTNYLDSLPIITSIVLVFGIFFTLILTVNLVRTVIKYFNFTIQKSRNSISLHYGLLATKNILLNPNKVQKVTVSQNFFQKKLDVTSVKVYQASSGEQELKAKDQIEIPGCSVAERDKILTLLYQNLPEKGKKYKPNWRKLAVNSFFFLLFPIAITYFLNWNFQWIEWDLWIIYSLVFIVFAGILVWFSFKNYRLFVSNAFIIKQNGAWDIDTSIIEPYKIQAIETHQFFWQKVTNIGSVSLSTAGGTISFTTANFDEIKQLVNYWLYQVEISEKNWM